MRAGIASNKEYHAQSFLKNNYIYFIIGIIAFFYLINNLIWIRLNTYPSGPDEFFHLCASSKILKFIHADITNVFSVFSSAPTEHWPPFFHVSSAILNLITGSSPHIQPAMINILYLIILLISLYFIGHKLFDEETAILAVIFISLYPMIFCYSRVFGPDFALASMVSLSLCFLAYSECFSSTVFTFLSGISFGLGMLTKSSFILFTLGPLLYTLVMVFSSKKKHANNFRKYILNIIMFFLVYLFISSIWYIPSADILMKRINLFLWDTIHYHPRLDPALSAHRLFQTDKFFYYLRLINNELVSFPFFVIFLIAVFFYTLKCRKRLFLILWLTVPYFILSLSFQKEGRHMLPSLPAIALISSFGLKSIFSKKIRPFLYTAIICLGIIQFFDISYNSSGGKNSLSFNTPIGILYVRYHPITGHHKWFYGSPSTKNWQIDKIVGTTVKHNRHKYDYAVGIICEDSKSREIFGYPFVFDYYLVKNNNGAKASFINLLSYREVLNFISKLDEIECFIFISKDNSWPSFDNLKGNFNELLSGWKLTLSSNAQNAMISTPGISPSSINNTFIKDADDALKEFLDENSSEFRFIERVELPQGYRAYLYSKNENLLEKDGAVLSFHGGRVSLWHGYKSLVPAQMKINFRYQDNKSYSSSQIKWKVAKVSDTALEAIGIERGLSNLKHIWRLGFIGGSDIKSEIDFKKVENAACNYPLMVKLELVLNNDYDRWLTYDTKDKFKNVENGGVVLKDATTKLLGASIEDKNIISDIFFVMDKPDYSLAQIHYTRDERNLIYWVKLNPQTPANGAALYATVKRITSKEESENLINMQRQKEILRRDDFRKKYSLNKGNLKIFFDFGQGRIYWREEEITDCFGFFTSIYANGYWHDSQNVLWEIGKQDEATLLAKGFWIDLPLSQTWKMKLAQEDLIEWKAELKAYETVRLEELQANIILSRKYKPIISDTLRVVSQDKVPPYELKFKLKNKASILTKKRSGKADSLNIKDVFLGYYCRLKKYFEKGEYKNYFDAEISIE